MCSQKCLWKWVSSGRCCKLNVVCFLTSYLRMVLIRERPYLDLEEYKVILSQGIGRGNLSKKRLMIWMSRFCATTGSGERPDEGQTAVTLWKLWMAWDRDGHKMQECTCSYNEQPIALLGCIFKQEKPSITAPSSLAPYIRLLVMKFAGDQQVPQLDCPGRFWPRLMQL